MNALKPSIVLPDRPTGRPGACRRDVSARYAFRDGEHELHLVMAGVAAREIQAVASGEAEFGLVVDDPLVLLCARFADAIPWSAARVGGFPESGRERERRLPPAPDAPDESRALLHIDLIGAEDGAIRAERNVTLWLDFTRALHRAIRDQARLPFDPKEHERASARLRRRFPTAEALVAQAVVRCFGAP